MTEKNLRRRIPIRGFALFIALAAFIVRCHALTIIPVWDASITNDPNAAIIENTINQAILFYEARFTNAITISITFQEMSGGLGESDYDFYSIPYSTFRSALQSGANTTNETYALSHLPNTTTNPVNGSASIAINVANLKALGLTGLNSSLPNGVDGIVSLNTTIMNLSRTNINPGKYDLLSTAEHEMDEVMGLGSQLPNGGDPFPQDLFRYSSSGARSFTNLGDDAYFSLDGTNLLVRFNQNANGDYGDWWSTGPRTPRVQDAFASPGVTPNPTIELVALNVQGWNVVPPPVPALLGLTLAGNNLLVSGSNGIATGVYHVLSSTNLTLPLNQWTSVNTNVLTNNGSFSFTATNAVISQAPRQFYVLQLQ